jgi:serine/threonine-protein kinase
MDGPEERRMSECLSPGELEALAAAGPATAGPAAAEPELLRSRGHLETCAACRERLHAARQDSALFQELAGAVRSRHSRLAEEIAGRYEILGEIHRGGQGVVYRALQVSTRRVVALKVLRGGEHATDRERHRFEREVELASRLRHPSIVAVHDSGVADGSAYYSMELIEGQRLDEFLRDRSPSRRERLELFERICAAVAYAHQRGVIHRDLKPANVLVDPEGLPHVLDFGLAQRVESGLGAGRRITETGMFLGTLAYASPEQFRGGLQEPDVRTDVYALGVILYEMLTGELPFSGEGSLPMVLSRRSEEEAPDLRSRDRSIDPQLATVVSRALARDPERRYASALDLCRDLGRLLEGRPIEARRDSLCFWNS